MFELPKSRYDKKLSTPIERQQVSIFSINNTNQEFTLTNLHLAHLTSTNMVRLHQIQSAIKNVELFGGALPSVIVGDFNYPFFVRKLTSILEQSGYMQSSFGSKKVTYEWGLFKGYFDRILYSANDWTENKSEILPFGKSDHAPLLSDLTPAT